MALKINVKDPQEFEQLIKNKNLKISKGIVTGILENLITKRKNIHVLEVHIKDDNSIVDITVHRDDFIHTLEENLKTHIHHEDYEACVGIQSAINYLKK